jgi:hypothetical protein
VSAREKAPEWYFLKAGSRTGQQAGPFSWEQLRSLAQAGTLEPADLVWNPQLSQWQLAAQAPDLFPALVSPGVPPTYPGPPPPGPSATTRGRSWLPWLAPIVALIIVGGGLGVYYGFLRDGGQSTASDRTTTTEAPVAWTDLNPAGEVPTARSEPAMVYDSSAGRMILFGGMNDVDESGFGDTWAYDPATNTWANLNPAGEVPSARSGHSMVYDPASGKMILFGGRNEDAGVNDTWAYDPSANTWTELTPSGASPSARINHQMVYDSTQGKVILFGGWWDAPGVRFANPWAYDPAANTWTELAPVGASPSARSGTGMVYDSVTGKVILFGGWDGESFCADTWSYDPTANTWVELTPTGDVPAARGYPAMVYDPGTGRVVLFGGWVGDTTAQINLNDTWAYGVTP